MIIQKNTKKILKLQKLKNSKIFEYLVALENGAIMWSDIAEKVKEKYDIPHKKDYGIDLMLPDFSKTFQVKYSCKGRKLYWNQLATFGQYSQRLKVIDMEVSITSNMTVGDDIKNLFPNIKSYNFLELCEKYQIQPNGKDGEHETEIPVWLKNRCGTKATKKQVKLCIKYEKKVRSMDMIYPTREFRNMIYVQKIKSWATKIKIENKDIISAYKDELGEIIIISNPDSDFDPMEVCCGQVTKKRGSLYSYLAYDKIIINNPDSEENAFLESYNWFEENAKIDGESINEYYTRYQLALIYPIVEINRMVDYLYPSRKPYKPSLDNEPLF